MKLIFILLTLFMTLTAGASSLKIHCQGTLPGWDLVEAEFTFLAPDKVTSRLKLNAWYFTLPTFLRATAETLEIEIRLSNGSFNYFIPVGLLVDLPTTEVDVSTQLDGKISHGQAFCRR
jgi:hypothetical protein